jgi:hypothetical protein
MRRRVAADDFSLMLLLVLANFLNAWSDNLALLLRSEKCGGTRMLVDK